MTVLSLQTKDSSVILCMNTPQLSISALRFHPEVAFRSRCDSADLRSQELCTQQRIGTQKRTELFHQCQDESQWKFCLYFSRLLKSSKLPSPPKWSHTVTGDDCRIRPLLRRSRPVLLSQGNLGGVNAPGNRVQVGFKLGFLVGVLQVQVIAV